MGLLSTGPAAAHNFTKTGGNDSRGRLDIPTASVSHTSKAVVHTVRTYDTWKPQSLGNDSFFVIQIDKNSNRIYERCAFIFYTNRLRGSLSNCGARFIRYLPVAKLSATTARVTIPKSEIGGVYWWGAASLWDGTRPCARGCIDFAPNRFPDILHDLKPPVVSMAKTPLDVWTSSASTSVQFPFAVSDAHSGISSWSIQQQSLTLGAWTTALSGQSSGSLSPTVSFPEGTQVNTRVVSVDKQGNTRIGPQRIPRVPFDDDNLGPAAVFTGGTVTPNADAFGGSYTALALDESFTYTYVHAGGPCRRLALIGPGSGDWVAHLIRDSSWIDISHDLFLDAPRQTLYSGLVCGDATLFVEVDGGSGFAVDAIAA
jgi:hypothetical protein